MILVEESLLHISQSLSPSKITEGITQSNANIRVRQLCNMIREQVGDSSCLIHPEYVATILIGASVTEEYVVKEVDFCCEAFEESVAHLYRK